MSLLRWLKKGKKSQPQSNGKQKKTARSRNYKLALEPRYLYDAAGLVAGLGGMAAMKGDGMAPDSPDGDLPQEALDHSSDMFLPEAFVPPAAEPGEQVAFVDPTVKDPEKIVAAIPQEAAIIYLNPEKDGVSQISDYLSQNANVQSLHIISHGTDGRFVLGSTVLSGENLDRYADQVTAWGESLSRDADILIYGCNVAKSAEGRDFIERLSELTGADLAASDDGTGAADQNGDWVLEYESEDGVVETVVVSAEEYEHTLSTIPVTSNNDKSLGGSGDDGVLGTSLREAIYDAKKGDTIQFDSSLNGQTITLSGDDIDITNDITIDGPGANKLTIDGDGSSRIFDIAGGTTAEISGLTLTNGAGGNPGGGAIYNKGELTINYCEISGNHSKVTSNPNVGGGGIHNEGDIKIYNSTLSGNTTADGGSNSGGGGIYNSSGTVDIVNSTLSGNDTRNYGGGIYVEAGNINIYNSTIASNDTDENGGGIYQNAGTVKIYSTIVADNTGTKNPDIDGTVESLDYNLIENTSGATINGSPTNDVLGNDPKLALLADNGGPTRTHAIEAASPARNAGENESSVSPFHPLQYDQRGSGYARDNGDGVDIGAYEAYFNHAPEVDSGTILNLSDVKEDAATNNGDTVAQIINNISSGSISDADPSDILGLAIVGMDESNGQWEYHDGNWQTFPPSPAKNDAFLLAPDDKIRFVPNDDYYGDTGNTLQFRAWDQSGSKSHFKTVDTSGTKNGGVTPFSSDIGTAQISVTPVEDTDIHTLPTLYEDQLSDAITIETTHHDAKGFIFSSITSYGTLYQGPGETNPINDEDNDGEYVSHGGPAGPAQIDVYFKPNIGFYSQDPKVLFKVQSAKDSNPVDDKDANGDQYLIKANIDTGTNEDPYFTSNPVTSVSKGETYTYKIVADDPDTDLSKLSITAELPPESDKWLDLKNNSGNTATLTGTAPNTPGVSYPVKLEVSDKQGGFGEQSFSVHIWPNFKPAFMSDPLTEATEEQAYSYPISTYDPDGNPMEIWASTLPDWLSLEPVVDASGKPVNGRAMLTGTPVNAVDENGQVIDQTGDNRVILWVRDGKGGFTEQNFTINVENVPDAPVFVSQPVTTVVEDTAYRYTVRAVDPDADDTLTLTAEQAPDWLTLGDKGNGTAVLSGTPPENQTGTHAVTLRAEDSQENVVSQNFDIEIIAKPDTPIIDPMTVYVDEDGRSGTIIIDRSPDDGEEVTHFKISEVTGGTLYHADGSQVLKWEFITYDQAQAGLVFAPDPDRNADGGFSAESSEGDFIVSPQSGKAHATVKINPIPDTPTVESVETFEDTPSDPIVIDRNALDGDEVSHFRISDISGGRLYLSDGTTPVGHGQFVSYEQGQAGLVFVPYHNRTESGGFDVEASQTGYTVSEQSDVAHATINVLPVGDTPRVMGDVTVKEGQASDPIIIDRHPEDGEEVSHFRISNISGGELALAESGQPVNDGDFISYEQAQAGLSFTPFANVGAEGGFDVESSEDGQTIAGQSGVARATVHIIGQNDAPVLNTSGTINLDGLMEDSAKNPGNQVYDLIRNRITDPDGPSDFGIAITAADNANGQWQYKLESEADWRDLADISAENALLLGEKDYIRFVPDENIWGAPAIFEFRAWDQSWGEPGETGVDTSVNGGMSAFSTALAQAGIYIQPVGDTPYGVDVETWEGVLSDPIVIHAHPMDGPEVSYFQISGISGGTLYLNDGESSVQNGDFIRYAQGQSGLRFMPDPGTEVGVFNVAASEDGQTVAAQSQTDQVLVTVQELPPYQANDDTIGVMVNQPAAFSLQALLENDDGGPGAELLSHTEPFIGEMSYEAGTFSYTPKADFTGRDFFTYTAKGADGSNQTATVTLMVVEEEFDALDDHFNTAANQVLTIPPQALLANDQGGKSATFLSFTQPDRGEIQADAEGNLSYIPPQDFQGTAVFSYTARGFTGEKDSAQVAIAIDGAVEYEAVADSFKTDPGTPVAIRAQDLLENDRYAENAQIVSVTQPENGDWQDNGDGTYTYTPDSGFVGTDTFEYTGKDGDVSSTARITITVQGEPPAYEAAPDSFVIEAGETLQFHVTELFANDTGGQGASLVSFTDPYHGELTPDGAGNYVYTPKSGFSGTDLFSYTGQNGNTDTAQVTLTIKGGEAYQAVDDPIETESDSPITFDPLKNDINGQGASIFSFTDPFYGEVIENAEGHLVYTPKSGFSGTDMFTYTGINGDQKDSAKVTVKVTDGNPVKAADDQLETDEDTALAFTTAELMANDVGATRFMEFTQPAHGQLQDQGDGNLLYTPDPGFSGADGFSYQVADEQGNQDQAEVRIQVKDGDIPLPEAKADRFETGQNAVLSISTEALMKNDSGEGLQVVGFSQPDHGILKDLGNDTLEYRPDPDYLGSDQFTYTLSNRQGGEDIATVHITVKNVMPPPPELDARADSFSVDQDTVFHFSTADLLANDGGAKDAAIAISEQPDHGGLQELGNGLYSYTPDADYIGTDRFTYSLSLGDARDSAVVSLDVRPVNHPPEAGDDTFTMMENGSLSLSVANLLANDRDPDGDSLSVAGFSQQPLHGALRQHGDGFFTFTYTPEAEFNGTDRFTYTLSDGNGGTDTADVTIQVRPQSQPTPPPEPPAPPAPPASPNQSPIARADAFSVSKNSSLLISETTLLANDSDPDGDSPRFIGVTDAPRHGQLLDNRDGTWRYTPDEDYLGTDRFTYRIGDGNGGYDTQTVTLSVVNNRPPRAGDDTLAARQGAELVFSQESLLKNDWDGNGDVLSVAGFSQPVHGTLINNENGSFSYRADAGFSGWDGFRYTVADPHGAEDTGQVDIRVYPAPGEPGQTPAPPGEPEPPVAPGPPETPETPEPPESPEPPEAPEQPDTPAEPPESPAGDNHSPWVREDLLITGQDQPLRFEADALMANDWDLDGDPLRIAEIGRPKHGQLTDNGDGSWTYTPANGYSGQDSFSYTVADDKGGRGTAVISIHVQPQTPGQARQASDSLSAAPAPKPQRGESESGAKEPNGRSVPDGDLPVAWMAEGDEPLSGKEAGGDDPHAAMAALESKTRAGQYGEKVRSSVYGQRHWFDREYGGGNNEEIIRYQAFFRAREMEKEDTRGDDISADAYNALKADSRSGRQADRSETKTPGADPGEPSEPVREHSAPQPSQEKDPDEKHHQSPGLPGFSRQVELAANRFDSERQDLLNRLNPGAL